MDPIDPDVAWLIEHAADIEALDTSFHGIMGMRIRAIAERLAGLKEAHAGMSRACEANVIKRKYLNEQLAAEKARADKAEDRRFACPHCGKAVAIQSVTSLPLEDVVARACATAEAEIQRLWEALAGIKPLVRLTGFDDETLTYWCNAACRPPIRGSDGEDQTDDEHFAAVQGEFPHRPGCQGVAAMAAADAALTLPSAPESPQGT